LLGLSLSPTTGDEVALTYGDRTGEREVAGQIVQIGGR